MKPGPLDTRFPPGALQAKAGRASPTTVVHAYLAALDCARLGERLTFRRIAERAGVSVATAHEACRVLRTHGLMTWEDGRIGTMRLARVNHHLPRP